MRARVRIALLAVAFAPAALGQLQLTQVVAGTERPVGAVFSFGSIDAGDSTGASFRLRNTGSAAASLSPVTVLGTAFLLVAAPVPASLAPQATFDFTVSFQPSSVGSYSATLQASGTTVVLTGVAAPALTWQTITPSGVQPLAGPLDFGTVVLGSTASVRLLVLNQTAQPMIVPAVAVSGTDFRLAAESPSGTMLQPLDSAAFTIAFAPTAAGARSGTLTAGTHTYALGGTGKAPPLPNASMKIDLASVRSAQQGVITVALDSPSASAASGTVTMSFSPAPASTTDPAITFASSGLTAAFTVAAGDDRATFGQQPSAAFSTGTTAGAITFTLSFGNSTSQQTLTIAPAAVGLAGVQATRQANSITLQATGFDNTRSAGKLAFTFYDATGNAIPPGAITVDSTTDFASYFRTSGLGGAFSLTAVFPVTGNVSQIAAFDFQMTNSAGVAQSSRTAF
jgi:hypothetical protein